MAFPNFSKRSPIEWWSQSDRALMGLARSIIFLREGQIKVDSPLISMGQKGSWPTFFQLGGGGPNLRIPDMTLPTVVFGYQTLKMITANRNLDLDSELFEDVEEMLDLSAEAIDHFKDKKTGGYYFRIYKTEGLPGRNIPLVYGGAEPEFIDLTSSAMAAMLPSPTIRTGRKNVAESNMGLSGDFLTTSDFTSVIRLLWSTAESGSNSRISAATKMRLDPAGPSAIAGVMSLITLNQRGLTEAVGYGDCLKFVISRIEEILEGKMKSHREFVTINLLYYLLARAVVEAGVLELTDYMEAGVEMLLRSQNWKNRNWDLNNAALETSLACCAMLAAGYEGEALESAFSWLLRSQNQDGGYEGGVFFESKDGHHRGWSSSYLVTAAAAEAMIRYINRANS